MLWVWIKTGFFGFVAMLFLFARAVQHGARSAMQVRSYDHVAVVVMGFSYVVMFLVFAYVDIAWDARTTCSWPSRSPSAPTSCRLTMCDAAPSVPVTSRWSRSDGPGADGRRSVHPLT